MAIRKQTVYGKKHDRCAGFVDYGKDVRTTDDADTLASEAHVFLLVGTRSHWKCPIGYVLTNHITSTVQAQLIKVPLEKAAEAGLKVWSITVDATLANLSAFQQLRCKFGTTYDSLVTSFPHPTTGEDVFIIYLGSMPHAEPGK